jgi:hypothetical protein
MVKIFYQIKITWNLSQEKVIVRVKVNLIFFKEPSFFDRFHVMTSSNDNGLKKSIFTNKTD